MNVAIRAMTYSGASEEKSKGQAIYILIEESFEYVGQNLADTDGTHEGITASD